MTLWGIIKGLIVSAETDRSKQLSLEIDPASTTATKTILKSAQTANRTVTLPDATDTLMGKATADVMTNKSYDADGTGNVLTNIDDGNIKAAAAIDASKIADGSVSNAEFQRINSVTSNVQTQLDTNAAATATVSSDLATHIADPTAAHAASAISNTPAGNITSTDAQAALNEVQTNLDNHVNDATAAHTASAIANVPSGNLVATDVQGALNEIQTQVDSIVSSGGVTSGSNVGSGAGQVFKQRVLDDMQFRTILAGSGVSVTNNTNDITIAATGTGANQSLSNLTNPTAINQDLIFDSSSNKIIGIDSTGTNPARSLTIRSGSSGGTDISAGAVTISTGTSTGSAGSFGIAFYMPPSGQASGSTGRSAFLHSEKTSTIAANTSRLKAPQNGGVDFTITNTATSTDFGQVAFSSSSDAPKITVITAENASTGKSGELRLESGPKTVAGNTGDLYVKSGNTTNGNSGSYFLETGSVTSGTAKSSGSIQLLSGNGSGTNTSSGAISITTGNATGTGTRGAITLSGKTTTVQGPFVMQSQTVGVPTTENQLVSSTSVIRITTVGSATINGIAAGVDGQLLIINNSSGNNISFTNQSGSASAADRITTQTGATITSTGVSMHQFIYLNGSWQYLSDKL